MFGYRIVRDREYDAVVADLRLQRDKIEALLRELAEAKAGERSKSTLADLAIMRQNVLEQQLALDAHARTGRPQAVASLGKGSPIVSDAIGAGVDLFEDVGNEKADELRKVGLLHEAEAYDGMPSAEALGFGVMP